MLSGRPTFNPLDPPVLGDGEKGVWGTPPNPRQEVSCTSLVIPAQAGIQVLYYEGHELNPQISQISQKCHCEERSKACPRAGGGGNLNLRKSA
jgi:hypothetical protein